MAIDEGVESSVEFYAWLQFSHDRRLLFCDCAALNDASSIDSTADRVVVLRPAWLLDACQNLLAADSHCCVQVPVRKMCRTRYITLISKEIRKEQIV